MGNVDMANTHAALQQLHAELGFELPARLQAILLAFEQQYAGVLASGQEVSFDALSQLLQPFVRSYANHQRLQKFFADAAHKYPPGQVYRRDADVLVDTAGFARTITFGSGDDGVRWFWNAADGAVWDYYLDDGSVGWVAESFDDWMGGFQLHIQDNWNVFLEDDG